MRIETNAARRRIIGTVIATVTALSYFAVTAFFGYLTDYPEDQKTCWEPHTEQYFERSHNEPRTPQFTKCITDNANLFIERDYPEIRDHAKTFLSLILAVFVASIAFSEKIIDLATSGWWSRALIFLSWASLFSSITAVGTGLVGFTASYWLAVHEPFSDYLNFANTAFTLIFTSGILFGSGLALMFLAGITSFLERQRHAQ
ncbi:MAG: hypothetical protein ACT4PZ_05965 [Panacagrimonas sp.]